MHPSPDLPVDRWVAEGILTADQARQIQADHAAHAPRGGSLLAEGLGYFGGAIVLVGLGIVLSLSWEDLTPEGRFGVCAGISVAFLLAGALVGAAGARLRGALWALGCVGVFASLVVLAHEVLSWEDAGDAVLLAGASTAVVAALLWALHRHPLQQLTTLAATSVAAGAAASLPSGEWFYACLGVWGVGVVWFLLSLPGIFPRHSGTVIGAVGATTGGLLMLVERWGPLIALVTVVALVVVGVVRRSLGVLGIGSIGTLVALPFAVEEYLDGDALAIALALVAAGLALVVVGVWTARRRREDTTVPAGQSTVEGKTGVDRWVAAGIVTAEQADRLRPELAAQAPRRGSLVAEGLGYFGGVIVLVGLGFVLSLSWSDLSDPGRVGVSAGIAVALLAAGWVVPAAALGTAGPRLRGAFWALGSVGIFATVAIVSDLILKLDEEQTVLAASAAGLVVSATLWVLNRHVLQHLTTIAAALLVAFSGMETAQVRDSVPGLALWLVGAVWFVLAMAGVLPRRAGAVLGAIAVIIGGLTVLGEEWGPGFALATVVAVVVTAVVRRELAVLGVASVGTLIVLPFAVDRYLDGGTLGTALALVAAGLALVATGILTARRRP